MKNIFTWALRNSFVLDLATALSGLTFIVFGSLAFTATQQMILIILSFYSCCRLYQKYEREYDDGYSLLDGRNLEYIFLVFGLIAVAVGIYIDICSVAR